MNAEFESQEANEILKGKDFYISYNPRTANSAIGNLCGLIAGIPNGLEETALYGPDKVWRILNGDFRVEYLEAFPKGYAACLKVYEKNIQHRSGWSTDRSEEKKH